MSKWMANLNRLTQHYDKVLDLRPKGTEGGVWKDYTHWGNHGTIVNATEIGTPAGTGFSFDGSTKYIDCGNNTNLNTINAITIETWMKINTWVYNGVIVSKRTSTVEGHWEFRLSNNTKLIFGIFDSTPTFQYYISNNANLATGIWYHLALVTDGTDVLMYRNGNSLAVSAGGTSLAPQSANIRIGKGTSPIFDGIIDEVRIYADALSAADILTLYNLGKRQRGL